LFVYLSFVFVLIRFYLRGWRGDGEGQIQLTGDQPLRDTLQKLGGWPVLDPDWKGSDQSVESLLGRMRGEFNQGVLVEQWVGPDDKNSSVNIIQVQSLQPKCRVQYPPHYLINGSTRLFHYMDEM